DVTARHIYPELSREEAHRKIGQRFSDRYLTTIVGRIVRTLALALGIEKFMLALPKVVALTSSGVTAEVFKLPEPGSYRLIFKGEDQSPDFVAGALEGGAQEMTMFQLRCEVVRREPTEFELLLTGMKR